MNVNKFTSKTGNLLEVERDAEISESRKLLENLSAKELERRGVCLLKLQVSNRCTGLYGRMLLSLELARHYTNRKLPSHSMTPGDIVGISYSSNDNMSDVLGSGIVYRVKESTITIAFEEMELEDDDGLYKITKLANNVTYKRLKRVLEDLDKCSSGPSYHLVNVLFGVIPISSPNIHLDYGDSTLPAKDIQCINTQLDESQRESVRFALQQREVAVIHGPPGTGKTTTVVEIILQAVKLKMKVLACAPSNVAVDNLVERLGKQVKIVRLGHPARQLQHTHKYSLDAILSRSDGAKIVQDIRKDIDKSLSKCKKTRERGEKEGLKREVRDLKKELRQREAAAIKDVLITADVVLTTNISASLDGPLKQLKADHFSLAVIDECAQALEASCWIPLLQVPRCVLAGDHQQLPPTVISNQASKDGLSVSLMERIIDLYGDGVVRMLTIQYRMNADIMKWSSQRLYDDKLQAHESVASHLLKDLPNIEETKDTCTALVLIDTTGCDLHELQIPDEMSKGNEGEADLVQVHVDSLIDAGIQASDIAVIAPYNLQVDLLRLRLSNKYPNLEIKSVDGFQGREKEAVVISLVRSNDKGEVGFLAEDRRINVAITRARRHLAVICDSETVSHHEFLKSLVDYMMENGDVRTAYQYIEKGQVGSRFYQPKIQFPKTKEKRKQSDDRQARPNERKCEQRKQISEKQTNVTAERESTIQREIDDFLHNLKESELSFPNTLNSYERFIVHEVAEKLGLFHCSRGEGSERYIMISKSHLSKDDNSANVNENEVQMNHLLVEEKDAKEKKDRKENHQEREQNGSNKDAQRNENKSKKPTLDLSPDLFRCQMCKNMIPKINRLLHEINCERKYELSTRTSVLESANKMTRKKKKPIESKRDIEDEDFDSMIARVVKADNTCTFVSCKTPIRTLGQTCVFCMNKFCLSHSLPEIHGCSHQAKKHAKQKLMKQQSQPSAQVTREKPLDSAKRANLQRKMDKKLNELSDKRRAKPSKK